MKKLILLFTIAICSLVAISATYTPKYRLLVIGDSISKLGHWYYNRGLMSSKHYNWVMVESDGTLNNQGTVELLANWATWVTPYISDTNGLWIRYNSIIHDINHPTTITDYRTNVDTILSRFKRAVGSHIIIAPGTSADSRYSGYASITQYNDTLLSVANRVLGAGNYLIDSLYIKQRAMGDSDWVHTADGYHFTNPVYAAMSVYIVDSTLSKIFATVANVQTQSFLSSGLPCIDSSTIPSSSLNFAYTAAGIETSDTASDTIPTIDSIRPTGGIFNTQVTVRGHTFGASPSGYLNGALVPYVSRSDSTYVFNVTDIPERGNVPVVIKNNTYNTYDTIQFFIFYNPVLASITPNHGKTNQGDTVEIIGDTLGAVDTIWFQNDFVIPFSVTDSLVKCEVPAHAPATVNLSVHDTNGYVDTLFSAYEYNNLYGWHVTHPSSLDTAGGDTIKFHSEYGQVTEATTLTFDGSVVALTTNTDTLSTYITPAHVKGNVQWIFDAFGTVRDGSVRYGANKKLRRLFNFSWSGFRF